MLKNLFDKSSLKKSLTFKSWFSCLLQAIYIPPSSVEAKVCGDLCYYFLIFSVIIFSTWIFTYVRWILTTGRWESRKIKQLGNNDPLFQSHSLCYVVSKTPNVLKIYFSVQITAIVKRHRGLKCRLKLRSYFVTSSVRMRLLSNPFDRQLASFFWLRKWISIF